MVEPERPLHPEEACQSIGLYFHLPFCTRKCDYCHFFVLPDKAPLKQQLMEGLAIEWSQIAPLIRGKKILSIYFGGGTPWLMGAENIHKMIRWVEETGGFDLQTAEITLEANPENVTREEMRAYAKAGVNRISIGIQSLDPDLLKTLSRQHSAEKAIGAVHTAYDCGITNISVDLMYDLPNQTLATWEHTLHRALELPITHLSLYNLTIEPHTAFYKHREKLLKQVPDQAISLQLYETAVEMLEGGGLRQYEISAFAADGKRSQHNTGYWLARPFLGLGPSAFSDWEGSRFQNVANLSRYMKALSEGVSPVDFREKLEPEARRRELLAIQVRLMEGVDLDTFERLHGKLSEETSDTLKELIGDGFLSRELERIKLTKKGVLFYDTVATEIV